MDESTWKDSPAVSRPALARTQTHTKNRRFAALFALLSLPVVMSLDRAPRARAGDLPSPLALGLMFVFFVTGPSLAWLFAWHSSSTSLEEASLIRFGVNRRTLILQMLMGQSLNLFTVLFGLAAVGIFSYYGRLQLGVLRELGILIFISMSWAFLLVLALRATRNWLGKWGLVLLAVGYPFAVVPSMSIPVETTLDWSSLHVALSPFFHAALLLGAFTRDLPIPAWASFACLHVYCALCLIALIKRVPR